jgi:pyridoxamine 5'-phosphate oxidase
MSDLLRSLRDDHRDFINGVLDSVPNGINPFDFFCVWFEEAVQSGAVEPNAMSISTVDRTTLKPSSRIVYLKEFYENGLVFYTNYNSQKAQEIEGNPNVALHFFWPNLERQVRICGKAVKAPEELSDKYFESRPRASQIGAWASEQSAVIEDRSALELKAELVEKEFSGVIPRPGFWGGYVVYPSFYEFWQGRPNRLHDRICFEQIESDKDEWRVFRKNP